MTTRPPSSGNHPDARLWLAEPFVRSLLRSDFDGGATVHPGDVWVTVLPDRDIAEHGWKLHVSARAVTFPEVAAVLVPLLLERGVAFKLAATSEVLAELNDGLSSPASVGKAFTIYPLPAEVRALGLDIADALRGHEGPRVLSDRQIRPDAPVYYRYGPFAPRWTVGSRGTLSMQVEGPDGESFDAVASLDYRQPSWAADPFHPELTTPDDGGRVLGERYEVTAGLWQSSRGNVFRARDLETGAKVVVKQGRAMVAESLDGSADARLRLRNELRILAVLSDVPGIARVVDHFEQGGDEYLVTTDLGGTNLADHASEDHPYGLRPGPARARRARRLRELARQLAGQLLDLHAHGVIMRDVTPRNVVLDDSGVAHLVDFGISAHDGFWLPGGTSGYAPEHQFENTPARELDDAHGLGMTLLYAALGMNPVDSVVPGMAALRALQSVEAVSKGDTADPTLALVRDLVGADENVALRALRDAAGPDDPPRSSWAVPVEQPAPGADDEMVTALVARVVDGAASVCAAGPSSIWAVDTSLYTGAAGLMRELVHHAGHPGVIDAIRELDGLCTAATEALDLGPGLYIGATGIGLARAEARAAGIELSSAGRPDPVTPPRSSWQDLEGDVMYGLAGVALGELELHALDGVDRRREVANDILDLMFASPDLRITESAEPAPAGSGAASTIGYAHGIAGVYAAVRAAHALDPERHAGRRDQLVERLAVEVRRMTTESRSEMGVPLSAGWCQGLGGIAAVLVHDDDPGLRDVVVDALEACWSWVPWMSNPTQCCGLVGVGNAFVEAAEAYDDRRWVAAAEDVARQLVRRSADAEDTVPGYVPSDADSVYSWGMGLTGALTFQRRRLEVSRR